jgi:hypothetical protein
VPLAATGGAALVGVAGADEDAGAVYRWWGVQRGDDAPDDDDDGDRSGGPGDGEHGGGADAALLDPAVLWDQGYLNAEVSQASERGERRRETKRGELGQLSCSLSRPFCARARVSRERCPPPRLVLFGVRSPQQSPVTTAARADVGVATRQTPQRRGAAQRLRRGVPLADLGYAFNFLGSFETDNAARAPQLAAPRAPQRGALDAFFVHGTTGLMLAPPARHEYFKAVVASWEAEGR